MSTHAPPWEEKIWGSVQHIFSSEQAAVSCLKIDRGFRCSCHKHNQRANTFAAQTGIVAIEEWLDIPDDTGKITLVKPGITYSVPSGIWHRFRVWQSGDIAEFYWPDMGGVVLMDDIERLDIGGEDDLEELEKLLKAAGYL